MVDEEVLEADLVVLLAALVEVETFEEDLELTFEEDFELAFEDELAFEEDFELTFDELLAGFEEVLRVVVAALVDVLTVTVLDLLLWTA